MNEKLIGKKIKLNDYNMTYGNREKFINVICFFKYLKDNNLYVIYCDDSNVPYGILNYGTAHLKGNTLIAIGSKDPNQEMVKEIVFKIHNKENLDILEIQDLSSIELIELVSPNKIEIKKEVLESIVDKTIPKPVIAEDIKPQNKNSKKNKKIVPAILVMLLFIVIIYFFFFFGNNSTEDNVTKSIVCRKNYSSRELEATVSEDNTYNFEQNDKLRYVNKSTTYKFDLEEEYLDFVNKGIFYSCIPEDNVGYTLEDETYSFIVIEKEEVTSDYSLPTDYEEVLSYYKDKGYECTEQIEE